ncbi:hypothetical protein Tco_1535058 [Tanacetum coccineum]
MTYPTTGDPRWQHPTPPLTTPPRPSPSQTVVTLLSVHHHKSVLLHRNIIFTVTDHEEHIGYDQVVELKIERWERTHGDLTSFCAMKDYEEMWMLKAATCLISSLQPWPVLVRDLVVVVWAGVGSLFSLMILCDQPSDDDCHGPCLAMVFVPCRSEPQF